MLQEGATLIPQAAAVVKEMAQVAQVYLIAHVVDDVGEATVRWAQGLCWRDGVLLQRHLVGASPAAQALAVLGLAGG